MGRHFIATIAMVAVLGTGLAHAGQGLSKFSVDSDAPKAAAKSAATAVAAASAKTPEGIECPIGIAQVKAVDGERFEYDAKAYKARDLAKALRKANKPAKFDCVVIEGGKPSSPEAMARVVKLLSVAPVKHVEWGGAQPDVIQQPKK